MSDWLNIGITVTIIVFIILIVWARLQQTTVIDILRDIREFIQESKESVKPNG